MLDPEELIQQKIVAGEISADLVEEARRFWQWRLKNGVIMPDGEQARISSADLHHLLLDARILRIPERIERLLQGIFAFRTTHSNRRIGLSEWQEDERTLCGYVIVEQGGQVRTMHITNYRTLRKQMQQGQLLWTANPSPYAPPGEDQSEMS